MPDSLVSPEWELIDPTPDPIALFLQYNKRFFWGKLESVTVAWSPRMTTCAGICCYEGRGGLCSIRLSVPLLKLRPRRDLVETLLHEMIHAFLFVTQNNRDRDGHGPEFQKHMRRINAEAKTNITIYHSFHDEVRHYQTHVWKCDGPCQNRKPYYGLLKRASNRAPGPNDFWWKDHQNSCGGTYHKISEPEEYTKKQQAKKEREEAKKHKGVKGLTEITKYFKTNKDTSKTENVPSNNTSNQKSSDKPAVKQMFYGTNILGSSSQATSSSSSSSSSVVRRIPGFGEIPIRMQASSKNTASERKSHTPSTLPSNTTTSSSNNTVLPATNDIVTLSSDSEDDLLLGTTKPNKTITSKRPAPTKQSNDLNLSSHLIDSDEELDDLLAQIKEKNVKRQRSSVCISNNKPPIKSVSTSSNQRVTQSADLPSTCSKSPKTSTSIHGVTTGTTVVRDDITVVSDPTTSSIRSCQCPICGREVSYDIINEHIDSLCEL